MEASLDTNGAAALIGVARKTLENWRVIGGGPKFIKLGGRVIYRPQDIREWMDARCVSSTAEMLFA